MVSLKPTTCGERERSTLFHLDENHVLAGTNKKCAHTLHLEIQSVQNVIQMALASHFSTCGCRILNLKHGVCATAIGWAFSIKGHQKENEKVATINARSPSKEAEQKSIETSCFGCPRVTPTAQRATIKIILHRIISVV
jgi:hypothetical protein